MAEPAAIKGTIGSRVRIALTYKYNYYGSRYEGVLVCICDDGDSKWESRLWEDLDAHGAFDRQLTKIISAGSRYVTKLGLSRDNCGDSQWYIQAANTDGSKRCCWLSEQEFSSDFKSYVKSGRNRIDAISFTGNSCVAIDTQKWFYRDNVPEGLQDCLSDVQARDGNFYNVCLSEDGCGWFVRHDRGTQWGGLCDGLSKQLRKNKNGCVEHIVETSNGEWLAIRADSFSASSGIPAQLKSALSKFYNEQKKRVADRNWEISQYRAQKAEERRQLQQLQQHIRLEAERQLKLEADRRAAEAARIKAEQERSAKLCRVQAESSAAAERLKDFARDLARRHRWSEVTCNETSRVIEFERTPRNGKRQKIQVFFTTRTVGTCINHPKQGPTQLFRRMVTDEELAEIFDEPRTHLGKGYQRKSQMASIPTPFGYADVRNPSGRSELDAMVDQLVGTHSEVDPLQFDVEFAHLTALAVTKTQDFPELDLTKGEILARSFISVNSQASNIVAHANDAISEFPVAASFGLTLKRAGIKEGDVILSIRISMANSSLSFSDVAMLPQHITKKPGLPYRLGVIREGIRHDIICCRNQSGGVNYDAVDSTARPTELVPHISSPLYVAGLQTGDVLLDITFPILHEEQSSDVMTRMPPNASCSVAVFRKSS